MLIDNLLTSPGPDLYYDPQFRVVLEDHMEFLRTHAESRLLAVEPHLAYKYEGDLYGLLFKLHIPFELHWVVMRMNKMTTPTQTKDTLASILIPNPKVVDRITSVHRTQNKIKN